MKCSNKILNSYIDGELKPAAVKELLGHLKECSLCAETLRDMEEPLGILRGIPGYYTHPPDSLWRRVAAGVQTPGKKAPLWGLGVAAAALMILAGSLISSAGGKNGNEAVEYAASKLREIYGEDVGVTSYNDSASFVELVLVSDY